MHNRLSKVVTTLESHLRVSGYLTLRRSDLETSIRLSAEALSTAEALAYRWGEGDTSYFGNAAYEQRAPTIALEYAAKSLSVRQAILDPHITCDGWMTPCYLSAHKLFNVLEVPAEQIRSQLEATRARFLNVWTRSLDSRAATDKLDAP